MSDRLKRLAARAQGREPLVQAKIGPRFGPEPRLVVEEPEAGELPAPTPPAGELAEPLGIELLDGDEEEVLEPE